MELLKISPKGTSHFSWDQFKPNSQEVLILADLLVKNNLRASRSGSVAQCMFVNIGDVGLLTIPRKQSSGTLIANVYRFIYNADIFTRFDRLSRSGRV